MKRQTLRPPVVLLVSKDKDLLRHARKAFGALGVAAKRLVIVRNESDWRALVSERGRPHLIVLDDNVASGDGPRLLGDLHRRLHKVFTVYVAEQHSPELERTVRQLGVVYYTEKPPDWRTLQQVLATVLSVSTLQSSPADFPAITATPVRKPRPSVSV